jgi:hypothetical protein
MLVHLAGCQEKNTFLQKENNLFRKKIMFKEIISENVERMADANS